jgi:glycosyltransferase involved in cell wall biosynthesis
MKTYKIAMPGDKFSTWGGGIDEFCNVLRNYTYVDLNYQDVKIQIYVILSHRPNLKQRPYDGITNLYKAVLEVNPNVYFQYLSDGMTIGELIEKKIGADICLPVLNGMIRESQVPFVSFVADFQEEHLKEFFDYADIYRRRKRNEFLLSHARYMMLISEDAQKDIEDYYPKSNSKIFKQPCAPLSEKKLWDTGSVSLRKYHLPEKYFLISNQFWKHKDHMTAFKALLKLREMGYKDICLVCTGKMEDYRSPKYISELMQFLKENDLESQVRLLGYIPKKEQIEIMKHALAVIQPTLFEGNAGGLAGKEAVAYGRPLILSDIRVNLELHNEEQVYFFEAGNSEQLAALMEKIFHKGYTEYSIDKVKEIYERNSKILAEFYFNMLLSVLEEKKQ